MTLVQLVFANVVLLLPGRARGAGARPAERVGDARVVAGARLRRAGRDVRGRLVADADASARARCGPRLDPVRVPCPAAGADPGAPRGLRRGRGARPPALARRREHRRRRALPPRARPEAGRVRLALARGRQRVRGRRAPSRLRVPALARLPRPRREGRLPRSRRGRAARGDGAGAGGAAGRVRGRLGALPAGRPGGRRRPRRRRRDGAGARTTAAPTPRSGCRRRPRARSCCRPRWRLRSPTSRGRAAACSHRSPLRGSCWRSSTRRTRSSSGCRSRASSSFARSSSGARRGGSPPRSRRWSSRRRSISRGCSRSSATRARTHPGVDELQRAFRQYAGQLDVFSDTSYRLAPEVFGRAGAVAVAALLFVPLAGLALRSRWAAYVLGGFLAVAAVMLVPHLFVAFSDLASISQSRRAAGFWPLAFSFAGGFVVLAALLRGLVLPAAFAGGLALQLAYPGEFTYRLEDGGPALRDLVRGRRRRRRARGRACVSETQSSHSNGRSLPPGRRRCSCSRSRFTPRRTGARRTHARRARSRRASSRRCASTSRAATSSTPIRRRATRSPPACPVYIAVAPPGHVADTEKNRPYERRDQALRFFESGDAAIVRRAGADWLVVDRKRFDVVAAARQRLPRRALHALRGAVAAASRRLDAEEVSRLELAARERRQLLAVQQRPSDGARARRRRPRTARSGAAARAARAGTPRARAARGRRRRRRDAHPPPPEPSRSACRSTRSG